MVDMATIVVYKWQLKQPFAGTFSRIDINDKEGDIDKKCLVDACVKLFTPIFHQCGLKPKPSLGFGVLSSIPG